MTWQNRIVGEAEVSPGDLLDHPENWRRHPGAQRSAMEGALNEIGWVQRVVVNQNTDRIIDGHLRVALARDRGDETVPVVYVNLSYNEERKVLASMDTITGLAEADNQSLYDLLSTLDVEDDSLSELMDTERLRVLALLGDDESDGGDRTDGGTASELVNFSVMMPQRSKERIEQVLGGIRDNEGLESIADALLYVCSEHEEE